MSVKVKALNWVLEDEDYWSASPEAFEDRLGYDVWTNQRGKVRVRFCTAGFNDFDGTIEEAKAVAQDDYERRILLSIETE